MVGNILGIIFIAVIVLGFIAAIASAVEADRRQFEKWGARAFCACGYHTDVPFGEMWFVRQRNGGVCPDCGAPAYRFEKKIARFIKGNWETKPEDAP